MSIRNTHPGIWLTFRCCRCKQLKLASNAGHHKDFRASLSFARERGWFIPAPHLCYCPKCAPAMARAWAKRKIV
jgi:hypothetical protein